MAGPLEIHAERVARRARFVRGLVDQCARRASVRPVRTATPQLTPEQAQRSAVEIVERARLVVEEWCRARDPHHSQLVAVAVMALRRSIELAVVEPVAEAAEAVEPLADGLST